MLVLLAANGMFYLSRSGSVNFALPDHPITTASVSAHCEANCNDQEVECLLSVVIGI